jgi:predicted phage terminase large subunit-like protein
MRRTVPELEAADGLVERSFAFFEPLGAIYYTSRRQWRFPSGARITLGHCEHERDVRAFGGWQIQYLGFDELTTFTEGIYTFLLSRLRSVHDIPCIVRSGTNPGAEGADWVLERFRWWLYRQGCREEEFAGPYAAPGERLWVRRDPDTGTDQLCQEDDEGAHSREFLPALLADNPHLARTDYGDRLDMLDPLTRRQLKLGDWMARAAPGMFFKREWCEMTDAPPTDAVLRLRYWDRAASEKKDGTDPAWTAGVLMSIDRGKMITVEDVARCRRGPAETEAFIGWTFDQDKETHGKIDQVLEQDPGSAGKFEVDSYRRRFKKHSVRGRRPTGDKVTRFKPFSAAASRKEVRIVRGAWNNAYFDELEAFPIGKKDQADATSGAYGELTSMTGGIVRARGRSASAGAKGGF